MLTLKDIKRLVETAGYYGNINNNDLFPCFSKFERQAIIRNSENLLDRQIAAAIEIQRVWQGYKTRSLLNSILHPAESLPTTTLCNSFNASASSEIKALVNVSQLSSRIHSSLSSIADPSRLELNYKFYIEQLINKKKAEQEQLLSFQGFCALIIQRWFRNQMLRISLREVPKVASSIAVKIVPVEEDCVPLKVDCAPVKVDSVPALRVALGRQEAARLIQRVWRKHVDTQVFQYYKQLVAFSCRGDPRHMLRCINPKEAGLLDSAAGAHVRFRLGGEKFPPRLYYKIFTHRNVADIGTFAPRRYTKAENKHLPGRVLHNRGVDVKEDDMLDWYERFENNGWRPVNEAYMKMSVADAIELDSSRKKGNVTHSKLLRRQDFEKRRKARKIEWMRKMYKIGLMKPSCGHEREVTDLIDVATEGLVLSIDERGALGVEEWEVDELLHWTEGLNFDRYVADWQLGGTTSVRLPLQGCVDELTETKPSLY